jgi:hypothetical protein
MAVDARDPVRGKVAVWLIHSFFHSPPGRVTESWTLGHDLGFDGDYFAHVVHAFKVAVTEHPTLWPNLRKGLSATKLEKALSDEEGGPPKKVSDLADALRSYLMA